MSEERGEMRRSDEGAKEDVEEVVLLETRPIEPGDAVLRDKFFEQYAEQAEQMDALGRQMITVELAVPGIYAAVLALLQGQDATLGNGWLVMATFGCWFLAMLLTFASLFPRNYRVDPTMIRGEGKGEGRSIGLATFFRKSAESKRRLLMISALVFWLGIGAALLAVFGQGTSGTP